jgi:ribonuclease HI
VKIEIYTDGSGTSMGSPGGWAFVVVVDGVKVYEESGSEDNATNNTMELTAALKGLEYANINYPNDEIILISDSQLVLNFAKGTWECKKLHLALLAAKLNTLFKSLNAKDQWVKGHSKVEHNERCDVLAGEARKALKDKKPNE